MAAYATLLIVLGIALYVCWLLLRPFFNVLLWATVLAVVFYPMHRRIRTRFRQPAVAAAVSTVLVIVFILLPVTFITVAIVQELRGAAASFQSGMATYSLDSLPWLGWIIERLDDYVQIDPEEARKFVVERIQTWGAALAGSTLVVVGGAVGAIVQMVLVVFTLFYLFRDGDRIRNAAYDILPIERGQARDIALRTRDVIGATVNGVLVIAAIQGTLGTIIFAILGLPSPLLWGVVMFFLSMIPMAGAFLVWVPAALYFVLTAHYVKAAILAAWGILVISSIDNFLSPRLVGQRASLHELLIFFSVLGGLDVFGVLGLILGPVVVAITLALIEMVRHAHRPAAVAFGEPGLAGTEVTEATGFSHGGTKERRQTEATGLSEQQQPRARRPSVGGRRGEDPEKR